MKHKTVSMIFGMLIFGLFLLTQSGWASNWLYMQGMEKSDAKKMRIWGFIQPMYSMTDGTRLKAGGWSGQEAAFNTIKPDLDSKSQFQMRRARIGARGRVNDKINYFMLSEFGDNGITRHSGGSVMLTDASMTLSYVKGMHIRVGQFKYPGSEEGLQAIHVHNYNNFATSVDQLLLERFFDGDGSDAQSANGANGPVGAFRDVGVQLFETFKMQGWEHSYAFMVGNGNGITRGDNNGHSEFYAYLASEKVFGGKGPRRNGWKMFAWLQEGKRTLNQAGAGTYDRRRYGLGTTFRKKQVRFFAEYIIADGMIFNGTDGGAVPGARNNADTATASFNIAPVDKANGWYVDFGYSIRPVWSVELRYDVLNRRTDSASGNERKFETLTLGSQIHLDKKTRVTLNYDIRKAEARNQAGSAAANQVLDSMDDTASIQLITIF